MQSRNSAVSRISVAWEKMSTFSFVFIWFEKLRKFSLWSYFSFLLPSFFTLFCCCCLQFRFWFLFLLWLAFFTFFSIFIDNINHASLKSAFSIRDLGLPVVFSQRFRSSILDLEPSACPTTVLWVVFITHPLIPRRGHSFWVCLRKNTPWTLPWI